MHGYKPSDKMEWSHRCKANWPCIAVPLELNETHAPLESLAARNASVKLAHWWRLHLDGDATTEHALDQAESSLGSLFSQVEALPDAVRSAAEPLLRTLKLDVSRRRLAHAVPTATEATRDQAGRSKEALHAAPRALLMSSVQQRGDGEGRRRRRRGDHADGAVGSEAMDDATTTFARLDETLRGFHTDEDRGRLRGYASIRTSLIAVLGEVAMVSGDKAQAASLVAALEDVMDNLGELEAAKQLLNTLAAVVQQVSNVCKSHRGPLYRPAHS